MQYRILRVIRAGTKNAVVQIDNGQRLKIPVEQACAGAVLEFGGDLNSRISVIPEELFRQRQPSDLKPVMLESMLY